MIGKKYFKEIRDSVSKRLTNLEPDQRYYVFLRLAFVLAIIGFFIYKIINPPSYFYTGDFIQSIFDLFGLLISCLFLAPIIGFIFGIFIPPFPTVLLVIISIFFKHRRFWRIVAYILAMILVVLGGLMFQTLSRQ